MSTTQTFLPGLPVGPVDAALEVVRGSALPHANYDSFVREVAAKTLGHRQGTLILCAAPADISCDEIIVSIADAIQARCAAGEKTPFHGVRVVTTPSGLRRGRDAKGLLNSYHHPIEKAGTPHRFQLQLGDAWIARDPFSLVASALQNAAPTACVFRNIHVLETPRHGVDGVADALQMMAEIANHSRSTHILMGHTSIVLEWLKRPEIARVVSPSVLLPYEFGCEIDAANFLGVLRAYDECLPWQDDSLGAHLKEIDQVVAGSPHRLRNWLVEALCKAKAENEDHLTWARLVSKRPRKAERTEAWKERETVRAYLHDDDDLSQSDESGGASGREQPKRTPRSNPPGIRNPDRNPMVA